MQKMLEASARVEAFYRAPRVNQVLAAHPPAALYSVDIDQDSLSTEVAQLAADVAREVDDGRKPAETDVPAALQCEPSEAFGDETVTAEMPRCRNFSEAVMTAGDGIVPTWAHKPARFEETGWDGKMQVPRLLCRSTCHATRHPRQIPCLTPLHPHAVGCLSWAAV